MANGFTMIVVGAAAFGLLGSILTLPSCHWVRIRGREETNRNVGLWRRSARSEEGKSRMYGWCVPYSDDFNVDSELKLARAASILAPLFSICVIFASLHPGTASKPLGPQLSLVGSILALIFQFLTLTVNGSEVCAVTPGAWCAVGLSTWAFWVALAAGGCYLVAAGFSVMQLTSQKPPAEAPPEAAEASAGP